MPSAVARSSSPCCSCGSTHRHDLELIRPRHWQPGMPPRQRCGPSAGTSVVETVLRLPANSESQTFRRVRREWILRGVADSRGTASSTARVSMES